MDKILRTVDANINRGSEGLRVLEDIFRFVFNDSALASKFKDIRHVARKALNEYCLQKHREVETDCGKTSFGTSEKSRDSVETLLTVNLKRVEESFRVLEEFLKVINTNKALLFKELRFQIYNIEQNLFSVKRRFKEILSSNRVSLYGIIDTRFSYKKHIDICKNLIKGGIKVIQLREKLLPDKNFLAIAKELAMLCGEFEAIFIVNDRADIAALSNADGVHLGQDDVDIKEAFNVAGFNKIYGISTHNERQVADAVTRNPDYIGFGPIFPTKSKENPDPTVGTSALLKVKEKYPGLPVVAIGGINFSNITEVIKCFPEMICIMSGIISEDDIVGEIKKYRSFINDTIGNS